jgi:hypothetical protein
MKKRVIGKMLLTADGEELVIAHSDQPEVCFRLDLDDVRDLRDFLHNLSESDFNQRRSFRVPIVRSSGLSVQLQVGQRSLAATPINISLTGILVQLPESETLDLPLDTEVGCILQFRREKLQLHGVFRRRDGSNRYGFAFRESLRGREATPPPALVRMVMDLERIWIADRERSME